ncbi:MAG: hypothetical protein M3P38_14270, partial [Chloroflexota bacterium]|nr:hypothetical protein [Chloroflexota bacterium]
MKSRQQRRHDVARASYVIGVERLLHREESCAEATEALLKSDRPCDECDEGGQRQHSRGREGAQGRGSESEDRGGDTDQPEGGDERVAARRDGFQLSASSAPAMTTRWISL